jgi:hypothetical protein
LHNILWLYQNVSRQKSSLLTFYFSHFFSDCDDVACQKMRLVLGHFLSCPRQQQKKQIQGKPQEQLQCSLCSQLIGLVTQHARYLCKSRESGRPCPVPMCDAIREEEDSNVFTLKASPTTNVHKAAV